MFTSVNSTFFLIKSEKNWKLLLQPKKIKRFGHSKMFSSFSETQLTEVSVLDFMTKFSLRLANIVSQAFKKSGVMGFGVLRRTIMVWYTLYQFKMNT